MLGLALLTCPPRLTGAHYLDFLRNSLEDLYAIIVREWLDENFPDKWIGGNGAIP
jgi:hypothetical protein